MEEEDFGDYVFDEEEEQQEEKNSSPISAKPLNKDPYNYSYEIVDSRQLKALFLGKLLNLRNKFEYANLPECYFLKYLREHHFLVEKAAELLQEKVCEMIDHPDYQVVTLDPKQNYTCNILCEDFPYQKIRHFGCGHTFEEECMKEYIDAEVKGKGPASIESLCPYDGCNFLITETIVNKSCVKPITTLFEKFTIDDFVKRSPFILPCVASNCDLYYAVPEHCVTTDLTIPQKNAICNCGTTACLGCNKKGHEPLKCDMFLKWEGSLSKIQDKLYEGWIAQNAKKCPKCQVVIQKNQGCMHMTCRQCRHEFCWLCLGDWKQHGSNTGGFFACNLYKDEKHTDSDAALIKKLQFFTDRFTAHKNSLELTEKKYRELIASYEPKPDSDVYNANTFAFPGSLDFYKEAFKTVIKIRSFVAYTYPLAYFIKNDKELSLFLQTQYMLEYALEKLDKFIETNPIQSFITVKSDKIYLSKDYPSNKQKMTSLANSIEKQFENANKEFKDQKFLDTIAIDQKAKIDTITDVILKRTASISSKQPQKETPTSNQVSSWLCTFCTFYNENSRREICVTCGRKGKPKDA